MQNFVYRYDSLYLKLKGKNIYKIIKNNKSFFDTSNYDEKNKFNMPRANEQVMGLIEDEFANNIITDFVALRPKMYAIKLYKGAKVEKKKCKGIKKCVVDEEINYQDYMECLKKLTTIVKIQNCIRSKKHRVFSIKEKK